MAPLPCAGEAQANYVPPIPKNARCDVQTPIYLGGDGLTYTLTRGHRSSGSRAGGHPVAPLPSEQHASVSGEGIQVNGAGNAVEQRDGRIGVIEPEVRWRIWIMFAVEKLASIVCIVFEMATLGVCFDDYVSMYKKTSMESTEIAELMDLRAKATYYVVLSVLMFGLVVEVVSALVLSSVYRSPLDIKCVHKIPPDDLRSCGGTMMVFFLAPFSWAVIYLIGGFASALYGLYASCGGNGGQGMDIYLAWSGLIMIIVGFGLLITSVVTFCFSFGSPSRCTDHCCATARRGVSRRILSKGALFEIIWILQGVVWSYRTGEPTQTILVVMIVSLGLTMFCVGGRVAVRYVFPQAMSSR